MMVWGFSSFLLSLYIPTSLILLFLSYEETKYIRVSHLKLTFVIQPQLRDRWQDIEDQLSSEDACNSKKKKAVTVFIQEPFNF